MGKSRFFNILFVVILVFLIFSLTCKKETPTSPEIENYTRPVIWINVFEMSFSASVSGANPSAQILKVKNTGVGTLNYSISDDADWLNIEPTSGTSTGNIVEHTVSVDKAGLQAQEEPYKATITISSSNAYNSPQKVEVSLKISKEPPPQIWLSSKNIAFAGEEGGINPTPKYLSIKNSGKGTLNYTITDNADWLHISPAKGSSSGEVVEHKISANISGLKARVEPYKAQITISCPEATNNPQNVNVSLKITKEPPKIWVSPKELFFSAEEGGTNPASNTLSIKNSGKGTLNYILTTDSSWLDVLPKSGVSTGNTNTHRVTVDITGLSEGIYYGTITVRDPEATNSPQVVNVHLEITKTIPPCPEYDKISIYCDPNTGGLNATIKVPITIVCNSKEIKAFGLELSYDSSFLQFLGVNKGNLTGGWASVDGNEISSGTVRIGGFAGSGRAIPSSSSGTIVEVSFKVICNNCSDGQQTQICISNYTDDISIMKPSITCATFSYKK